MNNFLVIFYLKSPIFIFFLSFSYLIKWFFHKYLDFILLFCVVVVLSAFDLLSAYQIMIVNMLKNRSRNYSSQYIIKFLGFMPIYYDINLHIVSSCMIFSYVYLRSIDLLQI